MTLLSKLQPLLKSFTAAQINAGALRKMSEHRTMRIVASNWQWTKFKDYFHFYFMLGTIPCVLGVIGFNVFVGPAKLAEIPEDYVPKHWEYYRNPITRFLARYVCTNPQQEYEKYLSYIFIENEKAQIRKIEKDVIAKMEERNDYQSYYYRPIAANYYRIIREAADSIAEIVEK
ncbi:NADH dehydrogenase [ubiquinone] 1 beta subcomplex subunit 5, mitochondrial [Sitophilus oryzae]|uniref:NADH dehydrogenase [ubiquinone] 1 beta subcomplex subunit 5, mitochondrial n=1 Tax=Sitophilus oryzae TaxID=7048 RepID=A0A6J2XMC9_SITOR|nr:NADH dehydrogenase [ubiquinone] 1 beta subcomplex subunit 5, mitochondrial [Sitophilus oryzae]